MTRNLQMSLKTKWFEMTKSGEKTEDYREINPYWCRRFIASGCWDINGILVCNELKKFNINIMTLGFPSKDDKERIIQFEHAGIEIREGRPEWGAEPGKIYFVIKHGKRI